MFDCLNKDGRTQSLGDEMEAGFPGTKEEEVDMIYRGAFMPGKVERRTDTM